MKQNDELDLLFDAIFNEDKKYWPNGLNKGLYNGLEDKINLLKDKDNKLIGFSAIQIRGKKNPKKAYYSIGILPEYRGHGYASKAMLDILNTTKNKDLIHYYTVHKDNIPSLKLYDKLKENYPELNLEIFS